MELPDKDTINTLLFYQLVTTFQNAAWQQLGKQVNPITQKVEQDLEQASLSINMLDMLQSKTKGNLSEEEVKFLTQIISDLKLNFVEEISKSKKEPAEDAPKGAEKTDTKSEETKAEATAEKPKKTTSKAGEKTTDGGQKKQKKSWLKTQKEVYF